MTSVRFTPPSRFHISLFKFVISVVSIFFYIGLQRAESICAKHENLLKSGRWHFFFNFSGLPSWKQPISQNQSNGRNILPRGLIWSHHLFASNILRSMTATRGRAINMDRVWNVIYHARIDEHEIQPFWFILVYMKYYIFQITFTKYIHWCAICGSINRTESRRTIPHECY